MIIQKYIPLLILNITVAIFFFGTPSAYASDKIKDHSKTPRVLGAVSNDAFKLEISDGRTEAAPGEILTEKLTIRNILYGDQIALTTDASAEARNIDVSEISDHGKLIRFPGEAKGGEIDWDGKEFLFNVPRVFTFKVKVPDKNFGSQFCTKGTVLATHGLNLLVLTDEDCTKVNPKLVVKKSAVAAPVKKPAPKITSKDFRILAPDSLNTDRADQEIDWYVSSAVQKKYPGVKIELCPGSDFKNCVLLEAVANNDGSQIINMPPVPRIGKWYLHLIARDGGDNLITSVQTSKRIELHQ
ncbi:MAG TPA: hypothetical protein VLG69_03700 [Candidatus Andersenbacteria bacterium]|nr:hypothetical protein [Candidatus Andersenbacteria bacterium]